MIFGVSGVEKAFYATVLDCGFWEEEISGGNKCMKELVKFLEYFLNNSKRASWDLSFLIRSRGRWGKCG